MCHQTVEAGIQLVDHAAREHWAGTSTGPWFAYAEKMCEIRNCGTGKSLLNCATCEEYACDRLESFFEQVPQAKKNLESLRQ